MCSRHTPKVHEKVSAGRVAICGLGGLGSNAAVYLARTGVGHLHSSTSTPSMPAT